MSWGLREAVGLTDEGTQCPNHASDQQQVAELLDAVGLPAGGTPLDSLPPIEDGHASDELCEAVREFQTVQDGLVADARVDVGAGTWTRLMELVDPGSAPAGVGTPLLLAVSNYEVYELPENAAAPWPSLSYTLRGKVAEWDGPGLHMELWVNGPVKVAWSHEAYNLGCEVSPDFKALDTAVASGSARAIGGVALDQLCSRLRAESREAIGSLFAAVSIGTGLDGTPRIGGTIGDETAFLRVEFEPVERTVIYTGSVPLFKSHPVTQGEAQVSGDLQVQLRITTGAEDYAASVATALAVLAIGAVFLAPTAAWVGGAIVTGVGEGVAEVLVRVPLRIPAFQ
ncbi:hypothetical protein SAMN06272735_0140 [Streptomyces sp. TLI_55]|uniref:hypothetical protein n=1 Tax=Streptomyces sp. TLI_55 TaxID=1938861 RepID=UPI000BC64BFE|nr:hypothetical protein [Streptomyces sp. TLI_55]SNX55714.1 hypothetical protein SAMN06272735_0140 [Streptomyces sp. TLI_55]